MENTTESTTSNVKAVDINALLKGGLFNEKISVGEGDSFARSHPVPDSKYVLLLVQPKEGNFVEEYTTKARDGKPAQHVLRINPGFKIESFLDPQADNSVLKGKQLFLDGPDFSTYVYEKDGQYVSSATSLMRYLGQAIPAGQELPAEAVISWLVQRIQQGTARIGGDTRWQAGWIPGKKDSNGKYLDGAEGRGKFAIQGQSNFPLLADGKTHNPTLLIKELGQEKTAYAKIVNVFSLAAPAK